ncbi:FAD-dependent oxidoreductase [Actinomadura rubrisoli]|uniref:FAD-dependent oxidoreductase n=1 Tax=Actinomadura rubrisoli TaxID=2530368 RepID=A0A4R5CHW8_9ACTN|nr:FAD-dependent oxidoreductase [Actinomadura rubrisoli]TDD98130.1 FAD-dependent oxidoreductase [Actinomadura rubrisoli]
MTNSDPRPPEPHRIDASRVDARQVGARVIVVGAGIAGLACAFRLQQQGVEVLVLERDGPGRVGGRMAGEQRHGVMVDLGAPLLAARHHRMLRIIADAGLTHQVLAACDLVGVVDGDTIARSRTGTAPRLLTGGLLRTVPVRDRVTVLTDLARARHRMHSTRLHLTAGPAVETLTRYVHRKGLDPRTLDLLLDPLNCTLSLAEPEDGAAAGALLFLAFLMRSGGLFTSSIGSAFLPRGLARLLPVVHHAQVAQVTSTPAQAAVHWTDRDGGTHTDHAQAVVLAVPADRIPALYEQLDPQVGALLASTRYSRLIQVTFHLSGRTSERAVLLALPRRDSPEWTSAVLQHNLSPARVSDGKGLVTCYLRGAASDRQWDIDDMTIVGNILDRARRMRILPELQGATTVDVDRISPCVVTRGPHDLARISAAPKEPRFAHPVLPAGGDLYGYSTTIGSLKSGEQAAARTLALLGARVPDRRRTEIPWPITPS